MRVHYGCGGAGSTGDDVTRSSTGWKSIAAFSAEPQACICYSPGTGLPQYHAAATRENDGETQAVLHRPQGVFGFVSGAPRRGCLPRFESKGEQSPEPRFLGSV